VTREGDIRTRPLELGSAGANRALTTFRRDGTPVSTPVWCASDDEHVLVHTAANSWKVKRIRRDGHIRVAACTGMGKLRGETVEAEARIVADTALVERLLKRKYGFSYRLIRSYGVVNRWLRRKPVPASVTIEIVAPPQ